MEPTSSRGRILATIIGLTVVAAYVFVTLLVVTPPNPVKEAFSGVTRAASPYFTQRWNVFAPNIARSNPELRIQAQWRDEAGELVKSEWVSITEVEFGAVAGHPLPSRIQKSSWNTLGSYLRRYRDLNDAQQEIVRDTFIERHDGGYRGKPPDDLIAQLEALGDDRGDVVDLLRYDYMVKEYATYFATAWFGEEIERIRWEIVRSRPNDWEHRFDDVQQHEPTITRFGWRQADDRIRPEALAVFEDVIARYGGTT